MTWAYSPSYGKPLSVPQGVIGLMTRFGMDVRLAYPEGYGLLPEIPEIARRQAGESGGSFEIVGSMEEAFEGADVVYPKSWAPYEVMQRRTQYLRAGESAALEGLEKECLAMNHEHRDWECSEDLMARTRDGRALYMHCLPADITGVSCKAGEVAASVFERYRLTTYREAEHKPYVIAAMILANRFEHPARVLSEALDRGRPRRLGGGIP
jgi:knotted carbamoyltransferase YgeW